VGWLWLHCGSNCLSVCNGWPHILQHHYLIAIICLFQDCILSLTHVSSAIEVFELYLLCLCMCIETHPHGVFINCDIDVTFVVNCCSYILSSSSDSDNRDVDSSMNVQQTSTVRLETTLDKIMILCSGLLVQCCLSN